MTLKGKEMSSCAFVTDQIRHADEYLKNLFHFQPKLFDKQEKIRVENIYIYIYVRKIKQKKEMKSLKKNKKKMKGERKRERKEKKI